MANEVKQDLVAALGVPISSADRIATSFNFGAPIHNEYVSVVSLRAALEKLPVVEGKISFFGSPDSPYTHTKFEIVDKPNCTHKARLFAIEEIKKEPVKKIIEVLVDPEIPNGSFFVIDQSGKILAKVLNVFEDKDLK